MTVRRAGLLWLGLAVLATGWAFHYLALDFGGLLAGAGWDAMRDYARGFLQPDLSPAHLGRVGQALLETLAMSAVGTLLAVVLGLLLALVAAGAPAWRAVPARGLANILRAVPELVWAALMVLAVGLGPNAGTLALALHTTGVLGRLYTEALENTPATAAGAIRAAGGGRLAAFCYGTLPGVWPQLLAYGLYRWENNIRMASILGLVGAGGLGQMLHIHLSLFQEARASTVILAMLGLVLLVDALSQVLRLRWVRR